MGFHQHVVARRVAAPRCESPDIVRNCGLCLGSPDCRTVSSCREVLLGAVGFLAIAVLFNPVIPIARSGRDVLWIDGIGLAAFLAAAVAFKARPALTVLSITSRLPRRESL